MWFFFVLFEQKIEIEQILIQKYTRYKKKRQVVPECVGACHYSFLTNDYSKTIGFKISGLYLIYEKLDSLLHGFKIIFNRREYQVAIDVEVAVGYVVAHANDIGPRNLWT